MGIINIGVQVNGRSFPMSMDLSESCFTERSIIQHLANGRFYEPEVSGAIVRMIEPGDITVDVGANVGFFSLLLGLLSGPEGRVVSFEPGGDNIARLRNNIALTKLENVTIVDKPAGRAAADVAFYMNQDNAGGHALWDVGQFPGNVQSLNNPQILTKRSTTIDDEMERLNMPVPKLIKVDVEGGEHEVLLGARKLLEGCKVPYVIAELHEFGLEKMNSSQMDLRRYMEGFGYDTFCIYYSGCLPKLIPAGTRVHAGHIINLLFSTPANVSRIWEFDWFDPSVNPQPRQAA